MPNKAAAKNAVPVFFPVVAAAGLASGVPTALLTVFNYFVGPMSTGLGITSVQLSQVLFCYLIVLVVAFPIVGLLIDRFGARAVLLLSSIACGISCVWIARAGGSMFELGAAFVLSAAAGAGASAVSYNRVIVHRFERYRGLALGITLTGAGLAPILLPPIIRPVILMHGWRPGFLVLGALTAGVGTVASLFIRGRHVVTARNASAPGLKDAMATATFWKMALAFVFLGTVVTGVIAHLTETWQSLGLDTVQVPRFQAAMGVATIAGRLLGGALMDRVRANYVAASAAVLGACGIGSIGFGIAHGIPLILAGAALGFCLGAEGDAMSFLTSSYFGLVRFARVYAVQFSFLTIGFAIGPVAFAVAAQHVAPTSLLLACASMLLVSAGILLTLSAPKKISHSGTPEVLFQMPGPVQE